MRSNQLFSSLLLLIISVLFFSCQQNITFSEFRDFTEKGWNRYDTVTFSVPISKTTHQNISIQTRNNNRYLYQNIWLFISCKRDSLTLFSDTIQLQLADKMGKWKGSGWGSLYELSTPYKTNFVFPASKKPYIIQIVQGMRDFDLNGIESVGMTIEPK